jgi:hypothetical protein
MPEMRSPGDFGQDMRKFFDSILLSPEDAIHKLGLPTPLDMEKQASAERMAVIGRGKEPDLSAYAQGFSPAGIISAFFPKPPRFMDLAPTVLKFD